MSSFDLPSVITQAMLGTLFRASLSNRALASTRAWPVFVPPPGYMILSMMSTISDRLLCSSNRDKT